MVLLRRASRESVRVLDRCLRQEAPQRTSTSLRSSAGQSRWQDRGEEEKGKNKKKSKEVQEVDENGEDEGHWNWDEAEGVQQTELQRLTRQALDPKTNWNERADILKRAALLNAELPD